MRQNKGFVFIETVVVIAILSTALIMLYSSFMALLNNEKKRANFDDVAYLYRTYYLAKYLNSVESSNVTLGLTDSHIVNELGSYIVTDENEKGFWEQLLNSQTLGISGLYVSKYDLSPLQDCDPMQTDCSILDYNAGTGWRTYLKTMVSRGDGYRFLGVYGIGEGKSGASCITFFYDENDEEACKFYYASIDVGGNQ